MTMHRPRRFVPSPQRQWLPSLAAGFLAIAFASGSPAAGAFDIAQLTAVLAQTKAGEATFTEKRQVAMLDKPLESSGRLSFQAPDTFVRETLQPRREKIAVVGNTLTMSQGSRSRTLALDASPEAGVIVEAIRGTLTGNRDALERHFSTEVAGSAAQWTLGLVPREPKLRERVAAIRIAGQQSAVREIQLDLPDGDRSVMTISPMTLSPMTQSSAGADASAAGSAASGSSR